jgi:hypothetical protein
MLDLLPEDSSDYLIAGGKPSKGTSKDKRLTDNRPPKPPQPKGKYHA